MAKAKDEEKVEATKEVVETKSSKTAYVVVDKEGAEKRIFTASQHGSEAKALAESFASKFGYKVK